MIEIPDEVFEEPTQTLEELLQERIQAEVANLVANANSETSSDRVNYSNSQMQKLNESVEDDLREFEKAAQEEAAANRGEQVSNLNPSDLDTEFEQLDMHDHKSSASFEGNTIVKYDLPGREKNFLHVPGYRCKTDGRVVVNIEVNNNGEVVNATVNNSLTLTSSSCLIEEALRSANRSKFFSKLDAPKKDLGSITYEFIRQ